MICGWLNPQMRHRDDYKVIHGFPTSWRVIAPNSYIVQLCVYMCMCLYIIHIYVYMYVCVYILLVFSSGEP